MDNQSQPSGKAALTYEERRAISMARRQQKLAAERAAFDSIDPYAPEHPLNSIGTLPDQVALSGRNFYSDYHKQVIQDRVANAGLRPMPYPCSTLVSIASDLDGSYRAHYCVYMDVLTGSGGMDFGDSIWLVQRTIRGDDSSDHSGSDNSDIEPMGFGFYSNTLDNYADVPEDQIRYTHTFCENIIEYHKGNIDHFHSFLPKGPRVAILENPSVSQHEVLFDCGKFRNSGRTGALRLSLSGLRVIGTPGHPLGINAVEVQTKDGNWRDVFGTGSVVETRLFENGVYPELSLELSGNHATLLDQPLIRDIAYIRVICASESIAQSITTVVLVSLTGNMLHQRLMALRNVFNVETPLITDHASYHFRDERAANKKNKMQAEKVSIDTHQRYTSMVHGTVYRDDGTVLVTTDSDDPKSVCRLFPELTEELDFAYVTPAGSVAASEWGWDLQDTIVPTRTRANGGLYVSQRSMPKTADDAEKEHSRAANFSARVAWLLKEARKKPGLVWPIYTHLGRPDKRSDSGETFAEDYATMLNTPPPNPYFEPEPILDLQEAVFGFNQETGNRVWFTRASQSYDFAYVMRHLPQHISRDGDCIQVTSWHDEFLNRTMPRAPGQLYGVSFYCDDPARTEVSLDGQPLILARHPSDDSGRSSVTVMDMEIKHTVFNLLDPYRRAPGDVVIRGDWTWQTKEAAPYGKLTTTDNNPSSLSICTHDLHPCGAQALTFDRRGDGYMGLRVTTSDGTVFYFGDDQLCPSDAAATYCLTNHLPLNDTWQTIVVPFNNLAWAKGAHPGITLPNAPIKSVEIISDGTLHIRELNFTRPRGTRVSTEAGQGYCVAGRIQDFQPEQTIELCDVSNPDIRWSQAPDQRGCFCFSQIPKGIFQLYSQVDGAIFHDRRGRLIEVNANLVTLELIAAG